MNEREIFTAAVQIPDSGLRYRFLESVCDGDSALRLRIEALLNAEVAARELVDQAAQLIQQLAAELPADRFNPDPAPGPEFERLMPRPETATDSAIQVGDMIGPYQIKQRLGEGGMGIVYVARQESPVRRLVALKILKPGEHSRNVLARFEQERQALAMMDHPNIAKVLDAGAFDEKGLRSLFPERPLDGAAQKAAESSSATLKKSCVPFFERPYFVMELVKGIPINDYCDRENLSPADRLKLFLPVCAAIQHAHQKGIIHRDLKPSNILVALYDGLPVPKVIDFGVAKATGLRLTAESMYTEVGSIIGTIEYMAPEQAELNNLDIDTRADIYSLGVILYELLTGSQPFTRRELRSAAFDEMLRMLREVDPPKPSTKLSTSAEIADIAAHRKLDPRQLTRLIAGDLDWVVMKSLAKERIRRYQTARELAEDLERFLQDLPVMAGPPSNWYRFRKFTRRHKSAVVAACVIALSLIGGSAFSIWQAVRATRAWETAQASLESESRSRQLAENAQARSESAKAKETQARHEAERDRDRATAAEFLADNERASAEAIVQFVRDDLLAQANPLLEPERDLKLRTVLDRAAKKIADRFSNEPIIEASIQQLIGDTYDGLGEYTAARRHLELRRRPLCQNPALRGRKVFGQPSKPGPCPGPLGGLRTGRDALSQRFEYR